MPKLKFLILFLVGHVGHTQAKVSKECPCSICVQHGHTAHSEVSVLCSYINANAMLSWTDVSHTRGGLERNTCPISWKRNYVYVWFACFAFMFGRKTRFSFFFFLLSTVKANFFNCEQCIHALFTDPQISLFINFFIKNGSHDTIHTFKNYFVIIFFSFQFSAVSKRTLQLRKFSSGMS